MTHIDKNSIKHFLICFLPALVGGLYGVSFALGIIAGLTVHWLVFKSLRF